MPTTREIAQRCNVSATTVSLVLNGRGASISRATSEKVLRAATDLGYRRSAIPSALARKRIDTVGIVFPFSPEYVPGSEYFSSLFAGVLAGAHARDQNVTVFAGEAIRSLENMIDRLTDGRIDGAVIVDPTMSPEKLDRLTAGGVRFVIAGETVEDASMVDIDQAAAAREAVRFLIRTGHRRIAMLGAKVESYNFGRLRRDGYLAALAEGGLEARPEWQIDGEPDRQSGQERAACLFNKNAGEQPDAIFCANDGIALGLMDYLADAGLRVPDEVSVVGFDDSGAAASSIPSLTTIRQPTKQIGDRAVNLLCDLIDSGNFEPRKMVLPHELVVRQSTRARL